MPFGYFVRAAHFKICSKAFRVPTQSIDDALLTVHRKTKAPHKGANALNSGLRHFILEQIC
jgi:hypothetical protein